MIAIDENREHACLTQTVETSVTAHGHAVTRKATSSFVQAGCYDMCGPFLCLTKLFLQETELYEVNVSYQAHRLVYIKELSTEVIVTVLMK